MQHLADRISAVFVPIVLAHRGWRRPGSGSSTGQEPERRVHRCGRGADHRVPVRARAGDTDGDHGRHRSRRAAGHRDQGRRRARGDAAHRPRRVDKTGTITEGRMELVDVVVAPGVDARRRAAARGLGRGRVRASDRAARSPAVPRARAPDRCAPTRSRTTRARRARDDRRSRRRRRTRVVVRAMADPSCAPRSTPPRRHGHTAVVAGWDGAPRAVFVVADTVKPTSRAAIAAFHDLGLEVVMATGDARRAPRAVADAVGIDRVVAGVLPEGKVDVVRSLQADGAPGRGRRRRRERRARARPGRSRHRDRHRYRRRDRGERPHARRAATSWRPPTRSRSSRRTLTTIKGNLFWAFAYNVAAIPLAALGCSAR